MRKPICEIPGQMSLFDIIPMQENHDFEGDPDFHGERDEIKRGSIERDFELSIKLRKCPECFEEPEEFFKSCHEYRVKCPKCGRSTEYFTKSYKAMQAWNRKEIGKPHNLPIREFLRYGPHTLISEVRVETREWLERYGVPKWVTWDKDSLPCSNCTWFDGTVCRGGAHTCHYEFDYLICDGFMQSIVERTPSTVGDVFPSKKQKMIKQEITDDYIRENPTCFYVFGYYLDREQGWHKVPEELPNFTTWHKIDVVCFGKATGTSWMELGKWEAKDWTFRSLDERRNTETIEILAWKLSDQEEK